MVKVKNPWLIRWVKEFALMSGAGMGDVVEWALAAYFEEQRGKTSDPRLRTARHGVLGLKQFPVGPAVLGVRKPGAKVLPQADEPPLGF
jgi:hypothetical protein